jgi:hypothetical protein
MTRETMHFIAGLLGYQQVLPITSILGKLALVPVGKMGTIPFSMRQETKDFPGASRVSKKDAQSMPFYSGASTVGL